MFKVKCIKCHIEYEDKEPDDYLCQSCLKKKKEIVELIDSQKRERKEVKPLFTEKDFVGNGRLFFNANKF